MKKTSQNLQRNVEGRLGVGIELTGVTKNFGERRVLGPLDLCIAPGEMLAVLGPSGCGKTTLLRIIAGLEAPSAGDVQTHGLSKSPGGVAYVFQEAHLLPWRDALANVTLPLELRGLPRAQSEAKARAALAKVGLADSAALKPHQLSGGMRMRVSMARALVTEPALMLLDEPFAALDEITRHRLDEELRELWRELGMTVVFVTHSLTESLFLAERIVMLSRRTHSPVLDRRVALPEKRSASLRTDPEFAAAVRALSDDFERLTL